MMKMIYPIYIQVNLICISMIQNICFELDFRRLRTSDVKARMKTNDENTNGTKRKAETSQVLKRIK